MIPFEKTKTNLDLKNQHWFWDSSQNRFYKRLMKKSVLGLRCTFCTVLWWKNMYANMLLFIYIFLLLLEFSKDRVPFLMHDSGSEFLLRTTNVKEKFPNKTFNNSTDLTFEDLQSLNAGEWFLKVRVVLQCMLVQTLACIEQQKIIKVLSAFPDGSFQLRVPAVRRGNWNSQDPNYTLLKSAPWSRQTAQHLCAIWPI